VLRAEGSRDIETLAGSVVACWSDSGPLQHARVHDQPHRHRAPGGCNDVRVRAAVDQSNQRLWELIGSYMATYARQRPVRKVAVVGNAPLTPDAGRAAELDSCDVVIRANSLVLDEPGDPPTSGTTCHVVLLSRSTRITPWVFRDYRHRAYLLMQAGYTVFRRVRDTAAHWPADLGALPVPNSTVTKRLGDLLLPDREPRALIPTTGTTGLFLAHELFPDADLVATGFSFIEHRRQARWGHHAGGTTAVNDLHRLDLEGALLESWVDDGTMRVLE